MATPTLRDWQHASRFYLPSNYKYVPKVKFLYHVTLYLGFTARNMLPTIYQEIYQIGMLVKSVDLPKYTSNTKTLNKYNRKKNVQTHISYTPVSMVFHDDNYGITRHLLEGYYKHYFADGLHTYDSGAYGGTNGDTTYKNSTHNSYAFGMDNNEHKANDTSFFEKIEISQLARGQYYMYTLLKPMLTEWGHDTLDNSLGGGITENRITVAYEGVNYTHGDIADMAGGEDMPVGFANPSHYDVQLGVEDSRVWSQPGDYSGHV